MTIEFFGWSFFGQIVILCFDKNIQALGMARTAEVKRDARIGEPAEQKQKAKKEKAG